MRRSAVLRGNAAYPPGSRALVRDDASVMPRVTSANTNAASLMIGERGARLILQS